MSSGERYSGFPARFGYFDDPDSKTMDLQDLSAWDLNPGNAVGLVRPMGALDPLAYLINRSIPIWSMRTRDIDTIFSTLSWNLGKCFDEDSNFYLQERADCAAFLTGTTHIAKKVLKAFMFVDNVTAEMDSDEGAMVNLTFVPFVKESTGPPIIETLSNIDLSLLPQPQFNSAFFLYSAFENDQEVKGIQSVTLSPQINFEGYTSTPGAHDLGGSVITREGLFSYRTKFIDEFNNLDNGGGVVDTKYEFYLQRADPTNANGDGRVLGTAPQHFRVACTAGRKEVTRLSVDGNDDAIYEVSIRPTGTMTFTLGVALPAAA